MTPSTSVGRYISLDKNGPVMCAGVMVKPGDWIVGDVTGVVAVPQENVGDVIKLLRQYDEKETKMVDIIKQEKSMLKALAKYNRY